MSLRFENSQPRKVVCRRVNGPWYKTVPLAFQEILTWSHANNIEYTEALVFYWDDPAETAEDEQRADVALTLNTGSNYSLNIPNLREEYIPGGMYAVWSTVVIDGAFAKAWDDLYKMLATTEYKPARGVCFEKYLCDGKDNSWNIEIWQSVEKQSVV